MKRFGWTLVLGSMPFWVGCGGSGSAKKEAAPTAATQASAPKQAPSNTTPPAEVVAQFLDSVRRGDEETATKLFTQAAIQEIGKQGITVEPPGSPDATFQIGETKYTDDDKDAALVELFWTETKEGEAKKTEAVFAVRLETTGWRIAGMVVANENGEEDVIDFENLAPLIAETPAPGTAAGSTVPSNAQPTVQAGAQPLGAQTIANQPSASQPAPQGQVQRAQQPANPNGLRTANPNGSQSTRLATPPNSTQPINR